MQITVSKLTDKKLFDKACSFTFGSPTSPDMGKMYSAEHSPIRAQLFWIEMYDIPTFVSVHMVRHSIGVSHFVKSNREDRPGYTGDIGRMQPVNHAMLINAQALINISRKRLCHKTHEKTIEVTQAIKDAIKEIDPELAACMVPDCVYRGKCCEMKPCGKRDE